MTTTTTTASRIRSRPPTGRVPWPLVLLEGEEKSGKSWSAALLSTSPRVGVTYWLDLGEGAADEYGAIPGARYQVLEHDGTYAQVLDQVLAVKDEAARAAAAGEPPVVLVIDSITALWELLKDWASERARTRKANRDKLARDPNAEITVSMDLWNDSGARYRRVMTQLLTFPGIVVVTARGKEVAALDDAGKPVEGSKEWKVEGHKTLPYDATAWMRMTRAQPPLLIGARSVHCGTVPGRDKPRPMPDFSLDWLVFDALRCDPRAAAVRDLRQLSGGEPDAPAPDAQDTASPATLRFLGRATAPGASHADLRALYDEVRGSNLLDVAVLNDAGEPTTLGELIVRRGTEVKATRPAGGRPAEAQVESPVQPEEQGSGGDGLATKAQLQRIGILFGHFPGWERRDEQLRTTCLIVGRVVSSRSEMTRAEAARVIGVLEEPARSEDPAGALTDVLDGIRAERAREEPTEPALVGAASWAPASPSCGSSTPPAAPSTRSSGRPTRGSPPSPRSSSTTTTPSATTRSCSPPPRPGTPPAASCTCPRTRRSASARPSKRRPGCPRSDPCCGRWV